MQRTNIFPAFITLVLVMMSTCSFGQQKVAATLGDRPSSPPEASSSAPPVTDVLIGVGDLLEVSVYGAPDFEKREVRVDSTGSVSLPLISSVKVAGLSTHAAEELLAKQLSDGGYFSDPRVS